MADVMPEVGAFGFVEGDELGVFGVGRCGEAIEFSGGALADFESAFDAHAKVPGIRGEFSQEGGGGRLVSILFGFEKELHEVGADQINGSRAKCRGFDKLAKSDSVFVIVKRDDKASARGRCGKSAEVEARDNG